jgi:hypothetical protein
MRDEDIVEIVKLFKERSAFWTSEGYIGAALYEALASDAALPENLPPKVIAALENVKPSAMAQRRKRGGPPSFLRSAQNKVDYPRASYCLHQRDRFVNRPTSRAAAEYTRPSKHLHR